MVLEKDSKYTPIQGFAPTSGGEVSGTYTPKNTVAVKLGGNVTITIDESDVDYTAGEGIILVAGVEYTFSVAVAVHVMGNL